MELTTRTASSNNLNTYPTIEVGPLLAVPNERHSATSAYRHTIGIAHLIDLMILLNAVVRRGIAIILNPNQARSTLYYYFDSTRLILGNSSKLPLPNASEYVFRFTLSLFSMIYSSIISNLFLQYVLDLNQQTFRTVSDVSRADLPVYCALFIIANNGNIESYCPPTFGDGGGIRIHTAHIGIIMEWLLKDRPRLAFVTNEWLRRVYWKFDPSAEQQPYRFLRPIYHQYSSYSVSHFDRNIELYDRLLMRAAEHGFLLHFKERNRRMHFPIFVAEQRELVRYRDGLLYNAMRYVDLQMAFGILALTWVIGSLVFVIELCTVEWWTKIMLFWNGIWK